MRGLWIIVLVMSEWDEGSSSGGGFEKIIILGFHHFIPHAYVCHHRSDATSAVELT